MVAEMEMQLDLMYFIQSFEFLLPKNKDIRSFQFAKLIREAYDIYSNPQTKFAHDKINNASFIVKRGHNGKLNFKYTLV